METKKRKPGKWIYHLAIICIVFGAGCKPAPCLRNEINASKYDTFAAREMGSYFCFKDSSQVELSNGKVFSVSDVRWTSCDSYMLIVRSIVDTAALQPGDTVHFNIRKGKGEQIIYSASRDGFTLEGSFYPVDIEALLQTKKSN